MTAAVTVPSSPAALSAAAARAAVTVQAPTTQADLIARLRAAALLLEGISAAYHYRNIVTAAWSPADLRYEADYLERNP